MPHGAPNQQGPARVKTARANNPFGKLADPLVATIAAAAWLVLLLAFKLSPQWDLGAARAFFNGAACSAAPREGGKWCVGFPLEANGFLVFVREFLHPLPVIFGIVLLIVLLLELWLGRRWRNARIRVETVLVATLIVGPGLIVNAILKAYWGRPRPWMTEDFGGWLPFVEAGRRTGFCQSNCSFVSGEGAGAGWLMCIALLLAIQRHDRLAGLFAVASVVMAGLRVAFGAHYLSDAILGYTMTIVIFMIFAALAERSVRASG